MDVISGMKSRARDASARTNFMNYSTYYSTAIFQTKKSCLGSEKTQDFIALHPVLYVEKRDRG